MLLDVNVLLALAWPNHQFHEASDRWLSERLPDPWHTCAITQLGFIRISSNPAFTEAAASPAEAADLCRRLSEHPQHRFVSELSSPSSDVALWSRVAGHRQTTDAYLVAVARHHGLRLVTFDQRMAANPDLADGVHLLSP